MNNRRNTTMPLPRGVWVMLLVIVLATPSAMLAGEKAQNADTTVTGSGTKYKTTVTRVATGVLSNEDLRQASLLTSQVLRHVNAAVQDLADKKADDAKGALNTAKSLIGIVRDILPVTDVTTVVTDAKGKEAYKYTEAVQDDVIALYTDVETVEVMGDILDAKKAEVVGSDYLGSVQFYTSVLADLGYIERKISAALLVIDKTEEATEQLVLAQVNGVDMTVSEVENPLLEARKALQVAEKQVNEKKYEPAKDNLTMARIKLEEYRALFGKAKDDAVKEITDQIETAMKDMKKEGVPGVIRKCWHMTVGLFQHPHPKTAKVTESKGQGK